MIKRWLKSWRSILSDTFFAIGALFTATQGAAWSCENSEAKVCKDFSEIQNPAFWLFAAIIGIVFAILKNKPKKSFKKKIRNKDSFIEIKIGDAFDNEGSLIVPINNEFDVSLNGNVKQAKSIQSKLIKEFYEGKSALLKKDLEKKLDKTVSPYAIGKTVEIQQKSKKFYLVVNSSKGQNNRVSSSIDDFFLALNGVFDFLATDADKDDAVTIPLLNTQHGRVSELTRDAVVKYIIDAFIDYSKSKVICDKLIIAIHPSDIEKGSLDFDGLIKYLDFQTDNYKVTKFGSKSEGTEISASTIKSINH